MTAQFRHHVRMLTRPVRLVMVMLLAALPALIIVVAGLAEEESFNDEVTAIVSGIGSATFPIAALLISAATLRDERDDGTLQVTYNGWPLYYYLGDMEAGVATGQGLGDNWYVLDATGTAIGQAAAAPADDAGGDDGEGEDDGGEGEDDSDGM